MCVYIILCTETWNLPQVTLEIQSPTPQKWNNLMILWTINVITNVKDKCITTALSIDIFR